MQKESLINVNNLKVTIVKEPDARRRADNTENELRISWVIGLFY